MDKVKVTFQDGKETIAYCVRNPIGLDRMYHLYAQNHYEAQDMAVKPDDIKSFKVIEEDSVDMADINPKYWPGVTVQKA